MERLLMNRATFSILLLIVLPLPLRASDEDAANPIVHLSERDGTIRWMTDISQPLPIFRSREAKQVRSTLLPNQKLTILEMDKFGFHVHGKAKNGYASGWTGWKSLLGNAPEKHAAVEKFRQRQNQLLKLLEAKRPAIGMSFDEIKLALGAPTKVDVGIVEGKNVKALVWAKTKTVDSEDILGPLAILSTERVLTIDTGSISAQIVDGLTTAVQIDIEGANTEVVQLEAPIEIPFSRVEFESREAVADRR